MTTPPRIRTVLFALAAGAFCSLAVVGLGGMPAGAAPRNDICTLVPALCPPTTPATSPTTLPTIPPTTKPVVTAKPPATTNPPATHPTATTTPSRLGRAGAAGAAASVGATGIPAPAIGPAELPALGAGTDTAAPQLAPADGPTSSLVAAPRSSPLSGLIGSSGGMQNVGNDHAAARIALGLLVLVIAGIAIGQLPAWRRSPRPHQRGR